MSRVYDAEYEVFGYGTRDTALSMLDARALVDRYVPGLPVERGHRRGDASTFWFPSDRWPMGRITLGRLADLPTVLHEIAHARTLADRGHGVAFQAELLRLVRIEMSPWWERRLRAAFTRHKPRGHVASTTASRAAAREGAPA